MTQPTLHATPRLRDVMQEQVRAVALALRTPAMLAAGLMLVGTFLTIGEFVTSGGRVDFAPELSMIPGMLGVLFPIGVWKGEERFGTTLLWTLPVDRRQHALAKVWGGWVCLMATVAVFLLWLLALSFLTGGNILGDQVLQVLPSSTVPAPGTLDPATLRSVPYSPEPLFWLVPFTAATGAYVLASAIALGSRHPLRWVIGVFFGTLLISALGAEAGIQWLRFLPARFIDIVFEGRYGFDALLTARAESLKTIATLADGKTVGVWRGVPVPREWVIATLLWTGAGLLALWAAASRHRERRRPTT